jgi:phage terminase large subunit
MMIDLPHAWMPRPHQVRLWQYLYDGGRHADVIWHRRGGKDDVALHHTICAAHKRRGSYIHFLPEYRQARKALWTMVDANTGENRLTQAFPMELREKTLDDEMFIKFKCGSTWQLAGSDRYDAIVGSGHAGIVFSEFALSNPSAPSYFAPMLVENGGWMVKITTPRGHNHAERSFTHSMAQMQAGKDYFAELLTVADTQAVSQEVLAEQLADYIAIHGEDFGRALWLQEYWCSFDAAVPGSIFGADITRLKADGRYSVVPLEPDFPVHTGWDLGRTDDTAIWFFQVFAGEVRIIDYHSSSLKDIPFYADFLKKKAEERGFRYGVHYLPHDAKPKRLGMGGKSILQQFMDYPNLGQWQVLGVMGKQDQIQASRATLRRAWIDSEHCPIGMEAMSQYHRAWDDEKRMFLDDPVHDFTSHCADAFASLAMSWRSAPVKKQAPTITKEALVAGSVAGRTMGAIRQEYFRKAKEKRGIA